MALSGAEREALRIGDLVKSMLERNLASLHDADPGASGAIAQIDDHVDLLQEAVKLYLSRLDTDLLDARHLRRSNEIVYYAVNLEHVGDTVGMGLSALAAKKARERLSFSDEGWAEIEGLYRQTIGNLRLSQTVFHTRDPALARQLVDAKVEVRRQEQVSVDLHLKRVRRAVSRRSKQARCIWTSCGTSSASTPTWPLPPIRSSRKLVPSRKADSASSIRQTPRVDDVPKG